MAAIPEEVLREFHIEELQAFVIWTALNDEQAAHEFFSEAQRSYFTITKLQQLYDVMHELYTENGRVTRSDLLFALAKREWEDAWAVLDQIYEHAQGIPPDEMKSALAILRREEKIRRLKTAWSEIASSQDLHYMSDDEIARYVMAKVTDALRLEEAGGNRSLTRDVLPAKLNKIREQMEGGLVEGIPVGFVNLNRRIQSLKPGDLIVLGGRPGMGKTSLLLNIAENVAARHLPVLFFSLEMSAEHIADKLLQKDARLRKEIYERAVTNEEIYQKIEQAFTAICERLEDYFWLNETRNLTVEQIAAYSRMLYNQHGQKMGLIAIDYLQLIRPSRRYRNESTARMIEEQVYELRALAQELKCPVVLLSQLNRQVEHRDDKRPRLADLRESGGIEQAADYVLFMYREDYYNPEKAEKNGLKGIVEIDVAKNRFGSTGKALLKFEPELMRFSDIPEDLEKELLKVAN